MTLLYHEFFQKKRQRKILKKLRISIDLVYILWYSDIKVSES